MNNPSGNKPGTLVPAVDVTGAIVVHLSLPLTQPHGPLPYIICRAAQAGPSVTAAPAHSGRQPKKPVTFAEHDAWSLPPSHPPPGPHAVMANAVVEHSNGEVSASYKIFDDKGREMVPEGGVPSETIYAPSQLDPSQPKDPAMFSLALGDVGTFPDGKPLLKRKVHNHLGEFMYPDGKRLRNHFPYTRVTASVGADHERFNRGLRVYEGEESFYDERDLSPPPRTIDLPPNFMPLHPSLRPRRRIVVPRTPTHLETSEPFFMAILKMVDIKPKVMRAFCYSINQSNITFHELRRTFKDKESTSEGANGEPKSPNEAASELITFLNFLVDYTRSAFPADYAPRACRQLIFSHAGDNFIFGRLRRHNRSFLDVVCIIDCAPVVCLFPLCLGHLCGSEVILSPRLSLEMNKMHVPLKRLLHVFSQQLPNNLREAAASLISSA
jgi:hypothetical protein